mgnify:CR=1 FL=1
MGAELGTTFANAFVPGHGGRVDRVYGLVGVQVLEWRLAEVLVREHDNLVSPEV